MGATKHRYQDAVKLCECGCNSPAPIAKDTRPRWGWVKGQPMRFIRGHNRRGKASTLRHGAARNGKKTPEYIVWENAVARCGNPNHPAWRNYGGRGIKFLFASFERFLADLGLRPSPKHCLDRMNNDGHYEIGNIHWVTRSESNRNRRPRHRGSVQQEPCLWLGILLALLCMVRV